jgi:hypothetical protein
MPIALSYLRPSLDAGFNRPPATSCIALLSFRVLPIALAFLGTTIAVHAQTILPDPTAGRPYSFQIATNPPQPEGTAYAADGLPAGLSINASTGVVSGTTSTVGLFKGTLYFSFGSASSSYPDQITVDAAAGAPTISSDGSAFGTVGTPFLYTIAASNSPASYNYAPLPPGLTASGALISGTPTTPGLFFTSISANNGIGQGGIVVLMFTISPAGPIPSITSMALESSPAGAAFSYAITATNSPTSFSAAGLPAGLSLDASTGLISGTPGAPQVASIPISAANSYGSSLPRNLILTIGNFSAVTSATSMSGMAGSAFAYTLTANNSPASYDLTGLPSGLSIDPATGVVSGTPLTAGTYTLSANAANALGSGPSTSITFTVTDPATGAAGPTAPLILVAPQPQSATVGSNAQFSVTAVGSGALGYQWSLNNIPISGASASTLSLANVNATDAGSYTVTVANSTGAIVSAPVGLTILSLFVPPSITSQPYKALATAGSPVTFTVGASGTGPLTYQWLADGVPIGGATTATFTLPSVQPADAGTYSAVASNPYGSSTSAGAVLTVSAAAFAPIFEFQPSPISISAGGTVTLDVGVVGSPPITYQWAKGGIAIPGATSPSLTFSTVAQSDAGVYSVAITDPAGSVTSSDAALVVTPAGGPPDPVSIELQPTPVSTTAGGAATFTVAATGDASIMYQWRRNQALIAGATSPSFTIDDVQASDAGIYDVVVSNAFSTADSVPTLLTVTLVAVPSRLTNVSARGVVGAMDPVLIIGFVVEGTGTETTLIRAVGPTLTSFGVTDALADPQLTLFGSNQVVVASNDTWGGTAALSTAFAQSGAFSLPTASADAAVLTSLQPGAYTAEATGANGEPGVVLLEAYDADTTAAPGARFVDVSNRGFSGTGPNVLSVGFVITGSSSMTVLIRGIGPTLAEFSVGGSMADPQLTVFDSNQNVVGFNDDWGGTAALQAAFNAASAFPLPPTSKDSAIVVTLSPGAYTAQVSGAGGSTGIALLEVYELP